jgi:hypothetical protein
MPAGIEAMKVTPFHDFDAALDGADVVMMLRLQQERMSGQFIPSPREYRHLYGLTLERLAKSKPDALVMHPGPMNRGIEIDSTVADLAALLSTQAGADPRTPLAIAEGPQDFTVPQGQAALDGLRIRGQLLGECEMAVAVGAPAPAGAGRRSHPRWPGGL